MSRDRGSNEFTTPDRAKAHDALMPLLEAMFREFQDLAKKKPDAVLNKPKVALANRLLVSVFEVLDAEPTRPYLDLLNEDELPQYSDVVLMLGQTVAAMEAFRERYHGYLEEELRHGWAVAEASKKKTRRSPQ